MRLMRKEAKAAYSHQTFHLRERRRHKLNKLYLSNSRTKRIEYQRSKRIKCKFRRRSSSSCGADARVVPSTVINL